MENYFRKTEIELWQKNDFVCFPIPANTKAADTRYKSNNTNPNQIIKDSENWGAIGTENAHNGIADFDNKEKYRKFAELMIERGYKVIETPHGWHIPFVNCGNTVTKMDLFDKSIQDKKIVEIQGYLQYVVGVGSWVRDDKKDPKSKLVTYKNVGSDKFWDLDGLDYGQFVDSICEDCNVHSGKYNDKSRNQNLRNKFINKKIPEENESNDYFHQAARVCLTDGDSKEQALERITVIYDEWKKSKFASDRSFYNITCKVNEVYDNPSKWKIKSGKHTFGKSNEIDRTETALKLLAQNEYYSNKKSGEVYQNKNGFLELINDVIGSELFRENPKMERADITEILNKIKNGSRDMPETNENLIVFKNGTVDTTIRKIIDTEEIADMGFSQYNYLEKTKANEPTEFLKFLDSYDKSEWPRLKMALRSIFSGHLDSRISVIHGISRVGKTTMLSIICKILGSEYAFSVDLDEFLDDRATRSLIIGKRLVVFQDLPETWKKLAIIKNMTGESQIGIREFGKKLDGNTDNKIKIFATANQLPAIKDSQKNAMYSARLSLIHNTRTEPFEEDETFEDRIIENEGEKILSWIINLSDDECQYETRDIVREEWESLANPQEKWLESEYVISTDLDDKMPVKTLCNYFEAWSDKSMKVSLEQMCISLKNLGYSVNSNIVKNILKKPNVIPSSKNNPTGPAMKHTEN